MLRHLRIIFGSFRYLGPNKNVALDFSRQPTVNEEPFSELSVSPCPDDFYFMEKMSMGDLQDPIDGGALVPYV